MEIPVSNWKLNSWLFEPKPILMKYNYYPQLPNYIIVELFIEPPPNVHPELFWFTEAVLRALDE